MDERKGYADLLRSPARRAILSYLAEHGPSRFMDIKRGTSLSTGVIYHHIRSLEGYIVQDENRMYRLTEAGMRLASLLSEPTRQEKADNTSDALLVNDFLLEFYPTAIRAASYAGLTPMFRRLSGTGIQLAVFAACLEFALLLAPHIYPLYTPPLGIYGFSLTGTLETFALSYLFIRASVLLVSGRGAPTQEAAQNTLTSKLAAWAAVIINTELLSMFSVGFAITYLAFLANGAPLVGQAASLILFFWGYFTVASAASYTHGLELIPSLLLPFATNMFGSALGQIIFEHYFQPLDMGFDLAMASVALAVAAWADRLMKSLFARGVGARHTRRQPVRQAG